MGIGPNKVYSYSSVAIIGFLPLASFLILGAQWSHLALFCRNPVFLLSDGRIPDSHAFWVTTSRASSFLGWWGEVFWRCFAFILLPLRFSYLPGRPSWMCLFDVAHFEFLIEIFKNFCNADCRTLQKLTRWTKSYMFLGSIKRHWSNYTHHLKTLSDQKFVTLGRKAIKYFIRIYYSIFQGNYFCDWIFDVFPIIAITNKSSVVKMAMMFAINMQTRQHCMVASGNTSRHRSAAWYRDKNPIKSENWFINKTGK